MVYAIIGWLWETPFVSVGQKKFVNRGFLRGPYIPIYGMACLTIVLSMKIFDSMLENGIFTIILQIGFIAFVSAVWEYLTSWSLEKLFKMRWWDYSHHKFNLNGRIALDYTFGFGIGGYILWKFINPIFENLYLGLTPNILLILVIVFYTLFLIDSYFTLRDLFELRTIIIKLNKIKGEISFVYDELLEKAKESRSNVLTQISEFLENLELSKEKELTKVTESFFKEVASLKEKIKNSTRILRLFSKFPKTSFNLFNKIKKISQKNNIIRK